MTRAEFAIVFGNLGITVTHKQAKPPGTTSNIKALVQSNGRATEAIINSYGVHGKQITIQDSSLIVAPEKYDKVTIDGYDYVIDSVSPIFDHSVGDTMGYRCYTKGKS